MVAVIHHANNSSFGYLLLDNLKERSTSVTNARDQEYSDKCIQEWSMAGPSQIGCIVGHRSHLHETGDVNIAGR